MTFEYKTKYHLGGDPVSGNYKVVNDTIILDSKQDIPFGKYYLKSQKGCIVNLEMHTELCADPDSISENLLLINYPQVKPKSTSQIEDLKYFLEVSLNHPDLLEYTENRPVLFVKEYFEINPSLPFTIDLTDKIVTIISEEEAIDYEEYLVINEIKIGIESVGINIGRNNDYGGNLTFFEKVAGNWVLQPRTLNEKIKQTQLQK